MQPRCDTGGRAACYWQVSVVVPAPGCPVTLVAVVLVGTGIWWMVSARHWFKGPKVQGTAEELAAIEADLEDGAQPVPATAGT